MIERALIEEGELCAIVALRMRTGKPTLYDQFVADLTPAEQKKLDRAIRRLSDRGLPGNVQKGRALKGHRNLFEVKERGLRVFWFESAERTVSGARVVVLTHGFRKKSDRTPQREIDRAEWLKAEYFAVFGGQYSSSARRRKMEVSEEYLERRRQFENDPDYILHGLLYGIAEDIYVAMEEQGLSQADLAERIGAKRQFVNRFLNTPHNTTLRTVVRLATALGLEFTYEFKPREVSGDEAEESKDVSSELEVAEA